MPLILFVLAIVISSFPLSASAHIRLKPTASVAPRSAAVGEKIGPCGLSPRVAPKVFAPGSTITVDWEETIDHTGRYEFYLSTANDANFVLLKTVQDNQNTPVVGTNYHQFSTTVTFTPGVTCDACTLRMVQVMTDQADSEYYSCADVRLTNNPTAPPAPTPTPSPTPAPQDPNCK